MRRFYSSKRNEIKARLKEFEQVWEEGSEEDIFVELVFCILTPQSKAECCWPAVCRLSDRGLLLKGNKRQTANLLGKQGVRFKNNKAGYIIDARRLFTRSGRIVIKSKIEGFEDALDARDWLVKNVKGMGYKEASHFLRNIGMGEDIAILDRHILKNLELLGVIEDVPKSLSKKKYFEIEERMKVFAKGIKIPMSHLDLLMWCKETGKVFK